MKDDDNPPEARGAFAHEVTIISADRPTEHGVVEGDTIRVTARPAQQEPVALEVFSMGTDPFTCPHCGRRTEWEALPSSSSELARQLHTCVECGAKMIVEEADPDDAEPEEGPEPDMNPDNAPSEQAYRDAMNDSGRGHLLS